MRGRQRTEVTQRPALRPMIPHLLSRNGDAHYHAGASLTGGSALKDYDARRDHGVAAIRQTSDKKRASSEEPALKVLGEDA